MFGGSYVGLTQWQPAIHTPPHLAEIAPQVTASDYHDHWTYVNGAFDLWFAQSWLLLTSFDNYRTLAPYYYDWIAHPNYDDFWAKMDIETRYENVKVPALNIG